MKVAEIMTKKVISVKPDTSVKEVAKILFSKNLTGVPVEDSGKLIGIITEADLVMRQAPVHMPSYIELLDSFIYLERPKHLKEEIDKVLGTTASDIMTKNVVTVEADSSVEDLADLIRDKHINPVPVMKDSKIVGIVSRADIVKLLTK